jgi:hypothetical protein
MLTRPFQIKARQAPSNGKPRHKLGGWPDGIARVGIPECKNCKCPFQLLLQIETGDPVLRVTLPTLPLLYVLSCLYCDAYWDPIYYRMQGEGPSIECVRQRTAESGVESFEPLPEKRVEVVPLEHEWGEQEFGKHQFGGEPLWLQGPEPVHCVACDAPMQFFAQVDSEYDLMIGPDNGMMYAFLCESCRMFSTRIQYS